MDIHTNGDSRAKGGLHAENGNGQVLAFPGDVPPPSLTAAPKHEVDPHQIAAHAGAGQGTEHETLDQVLQAFKHWDQAFKAELQESRNQLQDQLQNQLQSVAPQLQEMGQLLLTAQQQMQALKQKLDSTDQVLNEIGEQVASLVSQQGDQAKRISNTEVSIGALDTETGKIKGIQDEVGRLDGALQQMYKPPGRWFRRAVATAAAGIIVLAGVYVLGYWSAVQSLISMVDLRQ